MSIAISLPIGQWSPFLKASLASLKAQESRVELAIMVASDDARIKQDIEDSGLKFAYSRFGPDAGQAAAIAEGWRNTSAPITAWLNADDALTQNAIETVLKTFQNRPEVDVFHGESTISLSNGKVIGLHPAVRPISDLLYRSNIISQPSCFIRRAALDDIGGLDDTRHFTMDWDLWIRLYQAGKTFEFTSDILSNVTWEMGTKTSSISFKRFAELFRTLNRTQPLHKTAIGLYAEFRQNKFAYTSEETLKLSVKPFYQESLKIINMHDRPMQALRLHHSTNLQLNFGANATIDQTQTDDAMTHIQFQSAIAPGECCAFTRLVSEDNPELTICAQWMDM